MPGNSPGNAAALVRYVSREDAKWVVENINGNIPGTLEAPVLVRPAAGPKNAQANQGGWAAANNGPYAGGGGGFQALVEAAGPKISGFALRGEYVNDENTLFIGNLPQDMTSENVYQIFSPFGPIATASAQVDMNTGTCKGFGFVNYLDGTAAETAIAQLNGLDYGGQKPLLVKRKGDRSGQGGH